jgi:hypothetical protein
MLCDPAALNHVLVSRSYDYPKPEEVRGDLAMILGKGILFAEGDDHRRQRRIMNPSFGPAHLRELVPTFFQYSHQLRDLWKELLLDEGSSHRDEHAFKDKESEDRYYASREGRKEGERVLNVVAWLNKLTLDIIGDGERPSPCFAALQKYAADARWPISSRLWVQVPLARPKLDQRPRPRLQRHVLPERFRPATFRKPLDVPTLPRQGRPRRPDPQDCRLDPERADP